MQVRQLRIDLKWNHMAIAEEGGLGPKPSLDEEVAGLSLKTEGSHPNIKKLISSCCIMPTHYLLYMDIRDCEQKT